MKRKVLSISLVVVAFVVSACGGNDSVESIDALTVVAFADPSGPRSGKLTITGVSGYAVSTEDFNGNSSTEVLAPSNLRLTLTLDDTRAADGKTVKGHVLSARALNYVSGTTVVLSPISTLIDAYVTAHPAQSTEVATAKVLAYLGLPTTLALNDLSVSISPSLFNTDGFYREANTAGSVQALVKNWVAEIDAGKSRSVVVGSGLVGGDITDLVFDFAEMLGGNFDKWAGGKVQGWLLQVTGINSFLDSIGLGDKADPVVAKLAALTFEVKRLVDAVAALPQILSLATRLTELNEYQSFLTRKEEILSTQASEAPSSDAQINSQFITEVVNSGIQNKLQANQMGNGEANLGMINLVRKNNSKYYSGKVSSEYEREFFDLYTQSAINQTRALNLVLEAAHAGSPAQVNAGEVAQDTYYINLKRQKLAFPNGLKPFDDGSVLDRETGLQWKAEMYDYFGYEKLLNSLKGSKWRLPTVQEVYGVMPGSSAKNRLPEGHKTLQYVPELMRYFGFQPTCTGASHSDCKHFADLGFAGSAPRKILNPGYVVTQEAYQYHGSNYSQFMYDLRVRVVNLYSQEQENILLKFCYSGGNCYESYSNRGPVQDWAVPVWLVRSPNVPTSLRAEFTAGFDPVTGRSQAKAYLQYSDGNEKDVTKDVIWSVDGLSTEVHISNAPDTSGQIQYRGHQSPNPAKAFAVTAQYPWYLSDKGGQSGVLVSPQGPSTVVYGNERVGQPALASLLVSPTKTETSQYSSAGNSFQYVLKTVGVMNTGLPQNQTDGITWTIASDDKTTAAPVTVDNAGLVKATKPAKRTIVTITATKGAATGKAYLVLN